LYNSLSPRTLSVEPDPKFQAPAPAIQNLLGSGYGIRFYNSAWDRTESKLTPVKCTLQDCGLACFCLFAPRCSSFRYAFNITSGTNLKLHFRQLLFFLNFRCLAPADVNNALTERKRGMQRDLSLPQNLSARRECARTLLPWLHAMFIQFENIRGRGVVQQSRESLPAMHMQGEERRLHYLLMSFCSVACCFEQ